MNINKRLSWERKRGYKLYMILEMDYQLKVWEIKYIRIQTINLISLKKGD